ncbi:MAG: hypothetical protein KJ718_03460 [Nanoarchaeota archaeon]|nr:hypothetical protein [Nanoarchaeota archaeon]MBU1051587.1 hypothetical protein [Nanoarchaeota archaeon]MBU1988711.1 hypothetical protein [Nanoarchaeota archaeon]
MKNNTTTKENFRNRKVWAKLKTDGAQRDYLYGYLDGTNNHWHFVVSDDSVICDRRISGAKLIPTVFGPPVETPISSGEAVLAFAEAVIRPDKVDFDSGSIKIPLKKD